MLAVGECAPGSDQAGMVQGILNIAKPGGWTSHDVVAWVRKTFHTRSVGHAGTLDPAATGVLLVCVGQATRVVEYLTAGEKVYRAVVRLGVATDTYDAEGQVLATSPVPALSTADLQQALDAFTGDILQVPPAYSAIKQDGVAAHRKARRGQEVLLPARPVHIERIAILDWQPPDVTLEVVCGPGTYIRSLAHDLGRALGCGGHLAGLVRTRSGDFSLADAVDLETLGDAGAAGTAAPYFQPIERALSRLKPVLIDDEAAVRLAHGLPIPAPEPPSHGTGFARLPGGRVAAILAYRDGQWWPHKVFAGEP